MVLRIEGPLINNTAFVHGFLYCKKLGIVSPVEFIVDTGSSRTTISESEARKLGIKYRKLKRRGSAVGIGGTAPTYSMPSTYLEFETREGSFYTIRFKELTVLKFRPRNKKERIALSHIKSILGMDVLKKFLIRFTRTKVILERPTKKR